MTGSSDGPTDNTLNRRHLVQAIATGAALTGADCLRRARASAKNRRA